MTIMMERPAEAAAVQAPAKARKRSRRHGPGPTCSPVLAGEWMEEAACRFEDPELFFDCLSSVLREKAKAVCGGCQVRAACLRSALTEEAATGAQSPAQNRRQRYGVRGGLTSGERWSLAYPGEEAPPEAE